MQVALARLFLAKISCTGDDVTLIFHLHLLLMNHVYEIEPLKSWNANKFSVNYAANIRMLLMFLYNNNNNVMIILQQ